LDALCGPVVHCNGICGSSGAACTDPVYRHVEYGLKDVNTCLSLSILCKCDGDSGPARLADWQSVSISKAYGCCDELQPLAARVTLV
jgi:hypothetical protein